MDSFLGLYIEHGLKSIWYNYCSKYICQRCIKFTTGDMAYVTDTGDGEWGMYVYDGSSWVEIGNQDSAATDAQTLTFDLSTPGGGFGGVETTTLGNISPGARIVDISVEITTPYSNYTGSTAPTIDIGDTTDIDAYMQGDDSDPSANGTYTVNPTMFTLKVKIQNLL